MKSNTYRLLFIVVCVLLGVFLSACSQKSNVINIEHESKMQSLIKQMSVEEKDTVQKSSGMIIYKDNSYKKNNSNLLKKIDFGMKDPDFDIKIKF